MAGELERRWNKSLEVIQQIEGEIAAMEAAKPASLSEKEREQLMRLGADLELAWAHPAATSATRKRIVRAALSEIIVRIEGGFIEMVLHWQGGDHTALQIKRNPAAKAAAGEKLEPVLVGVGSFSSLQRAYPNFFLDAGEFVRIVRKKILKT